MKKLLGLLILIPILFASCKKKDVQLTTAQKLQAKWALNNSVDTDFTTNPATVTTEVYSNTFVEFKANNVAEYSSPLGNQLTSYSVLNSQYILFGGDSAQIKTLNSTTLQLRIIDRASNGSVAYESILNLSK